MVPKVFEPLKFYCITCTEKTSKSVYCNLFLCLVSLIKSEAVIYNRTVVSKYMRYDTVVTVLRSSGQLNRKIILNSISLDTMCIVNFFLVVVVILCTDVYGQLTECWMQSCTIMKALEATSQTIMTKQDELNSKLGSTFSVPSIADVESNITSTFSADISTAESNVITALESSKEDVIMSVNSSMTDTIAKINDAIAAEVGASEGNVVSMLMSELATSESKVITVVNASIADTVSKINDATAAEIGASENNVVSAFISELATSENKVLTALNGSNADTIAKLDDTIAAVSASEDNVVSSLKSELQISENKVITAVLGEMEMSQKNLTTKLDEVLSVINSTPAPPSSGFTVDSNVQGKFISIIVLSSFYR